MISPHALARYRERFDYTATAEDIVALLHVAEPPDEWLCEALDERESAVPNAHYLIEGDAVFILARQSEMTFGGRRTRPEFALVTVLRKEWIKSR